MYFVIALELVLQEFQFYKMASQKIPVIHERFLHLRAYFTAITDSVKKATKMLNRVMDLSQKKQNVNEVLWAKKNKKAWVEMDGYQEKVGKEKTDAEENFWTSSTIQVKPWDIIQTNKDFDVKYVLPLPQWLTK